MAVIIPQISADQGGNAAITFYGFGKSMPTIKYTAILSAKQGAPLVQAALTPVFPQMVTAPPTPLPAQLTVPLPSMTPGQVTPGTGMNCMASRGAMNTGEGGDGTGNWLCDLGAWLDTNPLLAVGIIAGVYVMAHGKK